MAGLNPLQFRQMRLPGTKTPLKQPHQMGIAEFANHPGTWFHGSREEQRMAHLRRDYDEGRHLSPTVVDKYDDSGEYVGDTEGDPVDKGFHVGSAQSAAERYPAYYHPVRIKPGAIRGETTDQWEEWDSRHHGKVYVNQAEDKGSLSAILASPYDVMTHGDFVRDALNTPGKIPSGAAMYDFQRQPSLDARQVMIDRMAERRIGRRRIYPVNVDRSISTEPQPFNARLRPIQDQGRLFMDTIEREPKMFVNPNAVADPEPLPPRSRRRG